MLLSDRAGRPDGLQGLGMTTESMTICTVSPLSLVVTVRQVFTFLGSTVNDKVHGPW